MTESVICAVMSSTMHRWTAIAALTTTQAAAFTAAQAAVLTAAQIGQLTTTELQALTTTERHVESAVLRQRRRANAEFRVR